MVRFCRLNTSLYAFYGLKQASRQWYSKLSDALVTQGYIQSLNDYSLFHKKSSHHSVYLVIYVGDLLITGDGLVEIASLKKFLHHIFNIKDLGSELFSRDWIHFFFQWCHNVTKKVHPGLLTDFPYDSSRVVPSPLDPSVKLSPSIGIHLVDPKPYRKVVGKLIFYNKY